MEKIKIIDEEMGNAEVFGEAQPVQECELCGEKDATKHCTFCRKSLCDECNDTLHKNGVFAYKKHRILPVEFVFFRDDGCPVHDAPLILYCEECNEFCCTICSVLGEHRGHKTVGRFGYMQDLRSKVGRIREEVVSFSEMDSVNPAYMTSMRLARTRRTRSGPSSWSWKRRWTNGRSAQWAKWRPR